MPISLNKISQSAPSLLKTAEIAVKAIDKAKLNGQTAKVAIMLDFSASMTQQYHSGAMQRLTEKVLALGTQFDDDGAIDFFVFDSSAAHLGEIGINDFGGSVDRLTRGRQMGSTDYTKAFLKVRDHFGFGKTKKFFGFGKKTSNQPVYVLFLTDGVPNDQTTARQALIEVSSAPIFWKFLSIGPSKIPFLNSLDTIPEKDRAIDNANYKHLGNLANVADGDMFDIMMEEFPEWLNTVRSKGLIQ